VIACITLFETLWKLWHSYNFHIYVGNPFHKSIVTYTAHGDILCIHKFIVICPEHILQVIMGFKPFGHLEHLVIHLVVYYTLCVHFVAVDSW